MTTIFNHSLRLLFFFLIHHCFTPVFSSSSSSSNTSLLLQDVLKEISAKQKWELRDIKVSRLDLRRFRFVANSRYEFRVGLGVTHLLVHFSDDVSSWKKFRKPRTDFGSLVDEVRSFAVLDTFKVEGPFELRVGNDDDNPSLLLPMNRTHTGFKRILVGKGITVEVRRARELSAFHASDLGSAVNGSRSSVNEKSEFWPITHSFCRALVQIQVSGPATFVTYRSRNPEHYVKSNWISKETIELLADKCYGSPVYKKRRCPVDSLSSTISVLEKVLKSYFGESTDGLVGLIRGKISASVPIRFQLELERGSGSNATQQADFGWRTRPEIERVWFDILARVKQDGLLKLLVAKKIKPPFIADTVLWSNLSNTSFTKFPSLLLPSEALTLDIKW